MGIKPLDYEPEESSRFKYNGKEHEEATGLIEFEARNHDPMIGRFHGVDPKVEQFGSQSPYVYANNNPSTFYEVLGENAQDGKENSDVPKPIRVKVLLDVVEFDENDTRNGYQEVSHVSVDLVFSPHTDEDGITTYSFDAKATNANIKLSSNGVVGQSVSIGATEYDNGKGVQVSVTVNYNIQGESGSTVSFRGVSMKLGDGVKANEVGYQSMTFDFQNESNSTVNDDGSTTINSDFYGKQISSDRDFNKMDVNAVRDRSIFNPDAYIEEGHIGNLNSGIVNLKSSEKTRLNSSSQTIKPKIPPTHEKK